MAAKIVNLNYIVLCWMDNLFFFPHFSQYASRPSIPRLFLGDKKLLIG